MSTIHHNFLTRAQRYRDSRTNIDGTTPVLLRVCYARKEKYISTGVVIDPKHWDSKKQRVKKHSNAIFFNLRISKLEERLNKYKMKVLTEDLPTDVEMIVNHVFSKGSAEDAHQFFEEQFTLHQGESSTLKKHRMALNYVREFSPALPFGKIDYSFVKDFEAWLLQQPNRLYRGQSLSQNYVNNLLSSLQYYTTEGLKRKLLLADPFKGFKKRNTPSKIKHLTLNEVEKIKNVDLTGHKNVIQESRDVFVFACYTGLRFQDLFYLTVDDFKDTEEGLILVFDPKKTKNSTLTTVQINVSQVFDGKALEIVKPYLEGKEPHQTVFGPKNPETHNSEFNKHLKVIKQAAGINSSLTAHIARHTCAMMLLNEKKWRLAEIKTYLGHSNITTTQKYAREVYRLS